MGGRSSSARGSWRMVLQPQPLSGTGPQAGLTEPKWSNSVFEGFTLDMLDTGEATLRVRHGGSGPPLLLLHGHPQTHVMWHKLTPRLAEEFTVVAPDLRGYGESSKPPTTPD